MSVVAAAAAVLRMGTFDRVVERCLYLAFYVIYIKAAELGLLIFLRLGQSPLTLLAGQFVDAGDDFRRNHSIHLSLSKSCLILTNSRLARKPRTEAKQAVKIMHDLIIIGGGPAGMTAAVYAARKMLDTLLVTKDLGGQMMWTREIENYLGFQYISGPELIGKFEEHVKRYPANIVYEEVTRLERTPDGIFIVRCGDREYRAKTVIIASGKRPRRLGVPGEIEYTGRGVGYCATCDGPLYAGRSVAVVGGGNSALQAAIELAAIASEVFLVVRGRFKADPIVVDKLEANRKVEVLRGYVARGIYGGDTVEKFVVAACDDGRERELAVQGVFVEIGLDPNTEFATGLAELNGYREIEVDCRTATGVPGLFAAGDVASGPDKQIIIAAGDGAKAALVAYEYLLRNF